MTILVLAVIGMIAARVAALIADSLVLLLTGVKTRQTSKSTGIDSEDSGSGLERTLKGILLRDSECRSSFLDDKLTGSVLAAKTFG